MGNGAVGTDGGWRNKTYVVLNGMVNTASTIADYRFYYYLVANTILVLAWVELYGMFSRPCAHWPDQWRITSCILAFAISAFGAWLGWAFGRFLKRTKVYERHYIGWAAKMEVDCDYCPQPYLWTGLIREFAEDINNLDNSHKCSRQQEVLKMLSNKNKFEGFWVR